ncbi:MAG: VWA domain-containing protein, partial [Acidobacteria bacterium]|nr:VWA domain-containing protein [Acidobacteriota bacterium]
MQRFTVFLPMICLAAAAGFAQETGANAGSDVIFRSDVSLVRVDAQVVDSSNRAITGLRAEDFVLREHGKIREIRNFASEDMPLDVLFLLDVSGSMQPHVQRMANAAHEAFRALGPQDRVGIMVFDRMARIRMPFKSHRDGSGVNGLERVVHEEDFNGGTDITRSLYTAVEYVRNNARREARKAIVILTDDMTEFERDDQGVVRSPERSDIVLSALLAPNVFDRRGGGMGGGGGYPQGGGMPRRGGN